MFSNCHYYDLKNCIQNCLALLFLGCFDINMFSILNSFILATAFQSVYGQFFGGGGSTFGGGFNGFGCGSYLPTVGNECFQPETGKGTVICVGKYSLSSSTWH